MIPFLLILSEVSNYSRGTCIYSLWSNTTKFVILEGHISVPCDPIHHSFVRVSNYHSKMHLHVFPVISLFTWFIQLLWGRSLGVRHEESFSFHFWVMNRKSHPIKLQMDGLLYKYVSLHDFTGNLPWKQSEKLVNIVSFDLWMIGWRCHILVKSLNF